MTPYHFPLRTLALGSLLILLLFNISAGAASRKDDSVESLIASISRQYPNDAENPYSSIRIGKTQYLVRDGKILKTKLVKESIGGMCRGYAAVWMSVSDENMHEGSEGEGSMWKFEGAQWKEFAHSSAGDWQCNDVAKIPMAIRKCLGALECS